MEPIEENMIWKKYILNLILKPQEVMEVCYCQVEIPCTS